MVHANSPFELNISSDFSLFRCLNFARSLTMPTGVVDERNDLQNMVRNKQFDDFDWNFNNLPDLWTLEIWKKR